MLSLMWMAFGQKDGNADDCVAKEKDGLGMLHFSTVRR